MSVQRPLAGVALIVMLLAAMMLGAPLFVFIDPASVLITVLGGAATWWMLAGHRMGEMLVALNSSEASVAELDLALVTARQSRRAAWMGGAIGTGIGLIQIAQGLNDPAAIGPAMAVCLLTLFYSVLLDIFVSSPLIATVASRRVMAAQLSGSSTASATTANRGRRTTQKSL